MVVSRSVKIPAEGLRKCAVDDGVGLVLRKLAGRKLARDCG